MELPAVNIFYGIVVEDVKFDAERQRCVLPDGRILDIDPDADATGLMRSRQYQEPSPGFRQANLEEICFDGICDSQGDVLPEVVVGFYLGRSDSREVRKGEFVHIEEQAVSAAVAKRQELINQLRVLGFKFDDSDVGLYMFAQADV